MELGKSLVTQTQKDKHHVFSFFYLGFLAPNLYKWVYNLDYVQKPGEENRAIAEGGM